MDEGKRKYEKGFHLRGDNGQGGKVALENLIPEKPLRQIVKEYSFTRQIPLLIADCK